MKIALVSHDADFTGAPRIGFDIASVLARDHDVSLISKREGPLIRLSKYSNLVKDYAVTKTSHAYGNIPFSVRVRRATEMLRNLRPALLYANSSASSEWCVAAHHLRIPSVLHTHEMRDGLKSLTTVDALKLDIPRYVDLLVSASQEAFDDFSELTRGTVPKHFLFGIGIGTEYVKTKANEQASMPTNLSGRELAQDRTVVAMCGMAGARKGFDIFFETARAMPDVEFLWIGPLSGDPTVKQVMKTYNSERTENFFLTGETPNPYVYMKMCDIFVLTSIEDPNPLVVPEARVLGKRILSFQNTGGSWQWTRKFGYCLSGTISTDRLIFFLRKMLKASDAPHWIQGQSSSLYDAVDLDRKLPLLRRELSELVGASV